MKKMKYENKTKIKEKIQNCNSSEKKQVAMKSSNQEKTKAVQLLNVVLQ